MKDKTHEHDFNAIPAAACQFAGGQVMLGDNGEKAKTAPVKIKARSGQPIEHWFWGHVVHDLAGMRTHKNRLPIDYAHNDSEVLGYLNHFDSSSGDLIASGAIIPFTEQDRASEVLFKMGEGVPYEASIFFGGDGIKLQQLAEGEVSPVNGYDFEGPGVIIREWPLRGVAICPYGADAHTESAALSKGQTFTAEPWENENEEIQMSEESTAVDVEVQPEAAEAVEELAVETQAEEAEEVAEEAPATEEEPAAEEEPVTELADASADAVRARLTAVEADHAQAVQRADEAEALNATVTAERDSITEELRATTEALNAVNAERDELQRKLDVLTQGAEAVSAAAAGEERGEESAWKKAQKR